LQNRVVFDGEDHIGMSQECKKLKRGSLLLIGIEVDFGPRSTDRPDAMLHNIANTIDADGETDDLAQKII
jgi:hypothetical protein